MSDFSLQDILQAKKVGEKYYSLEAPEELHVWTRKNKWARDAFLSRGVEPQVFTVKGEFCPPTETTKFTAKNPMNLRKNGLLIKRGLLVISQSKRASFTFPAEDVPEINSIMEELSEETDINTWQIQRLRIWSKDALVNFKRHNPNSTGVSLFLYSVKRNKKERKYPEVMLSEQFELVGKFYNRCLSCTMTERLVIEPGCALKFLREKKKREKRGQIRLRKHSGGEQEHLNPA